MASFVKERLGDSVSIVHVLPYFPWTSDDGFAVANYNQVNSDLGDWSDLENLSQDYRVMSDLVVNHCSTEEWLDLISGDILEDEEGDVVLAPYQCVWLANRRKHLPY